MTPRIRTASPSPVPRPAAAPRRGICASLGAAALALAGALSVAPAPAAAEMTFDLYSGYQTSPHSRVSGDHPDGGAYDALIGWEGRSFDMPPYYGLRGTWWRSETLGYALEFTHAKVYAPDDEKAAAGFSRMEFTDGLNLLTLGVTRRWPGVWGGGAVTPYLGAGLGVAVPHVDVTSAGGERTFGYQLTGAALRLTAGARYAINDRWSAFGEYQFTASQNDADLEGGGSLSTRIITNAVNVGVGYSF